MSEKLFKGPIVGWILEDNHIIGVTPARAKQDWVGIRTSEVVRIFRDHRNVLWCETQNSRYVLL